MLKRANLPAGLLHLLEALKFFSTSCKVAQIVIFTGLDQNIVWFDVEMEIPDVMEPLDRL